MVWNYKYWHRAAAWASYLKGGFPKHQQTNPPQHTFVPRMETNCHESLKKLTAV
jgi:hypothetical protein